MKEEEEDEEEEDEEEEVLVKNIGHILLNFISQYVNIVTCIMGIKLY